MFFYEYGFQHKTPCAGLLQPRLVVSSTCQALQLLHVWLSSEGRPLRILAYGRMRRALRRCRLSRCISSWLYRDGRRIKWLGSLGTVLRSRTMMILGGMLHVVVIGCISCFREFCCRGEIFGTYASISMWIRFQTFVYISLGGGGCWIIMPLGARSSLKTDTTDLDSVGFVPSQFHYEPEWIFFFHGIVQC